MKINNNVFFRLAPGTSKLLEQSFHWLAVVAILLVVLLLFFGMPQNQSIDAKVSQLDRVPQKWIEQTPEALNLTVDAIPKPSITESLKVLHSLGVQITWQLPIGITLPNQALSVEPIADPHHPIRILTAIDENTQATLSASHAMFNERLATLNKSSHVVLPLDNRMLLLASGGLDASAMLQQTVELKPLLVLGQAGWETRFITSALEEHGWLVDSHIMLSPDQIAGKKVKPQQQNLQQANGQEASTVTENRRSGRSAGGRSPGGRSIGGRSTPNNNRSTTKATKNTAQAEPDIILSDYSAVLLIDDSLVESGNLTSRMLRQYLSDGGGVVVFPQAAKSRTLRAFLPAGSLGLPEDPLPFEQVNKKQNSGVNGTAELEQARLKHGLSLYPLERLKTNAQIIEQRQEHISVAARRYKQGRIVQVGYADLWRWPMVSPRENAKEEFRLWLAGLVSLIAYAPNQDYQSFNLLSLQSDPAPVARWYQSFGNPQIIPVVSGHFNSWFTPRLDVIWTLFIVALLALLIEWLLRRLRSEA